MGPNDVLLALSLDFEDEIKAGEVERIIGEIEREIKSLNSEIQHIFIEIQSRIDHMADAAITHQDQS